MLGVEMSSSLLVFYTFGRTCVWVWPENNGYISLMNKVETFFEIPEFVRILPRTVGFWLKHLLKSVWGRAKPLPGLIHSEESRLLNVRALTNGCVSAFWPIPLHIIGSQRKDLNQGWVVSSRWSSYLWKNICLLHYQVISHLLSH